MRWGFRTNAGHTEEPPKPCSIPGVGTERRVEEGREGGRTQLVQSGK